MQYREDKMNQKPFIPDLKYYPPWQSHGEAYILNYWASPSMLEHAKAFDLTASRTGHMLHVILVRYHDTPIGPYDALFIVDHPVINRQRVSLIPKIFVSNQESALYGQTLWGLPKQVAEFTWTQTSTDMYCQIQYGQESMMIQLNHHKNSPSFYVNSHQLPKSILNIRQTWQGQFYRFTPQFRGKLCKLKSVQWHNIGNLFPDFSKARYIHSFYMPEVQLVLPEAHIQAMKMVSRETL